MPGSVEDPVRLWPFSRIVEVGWPSVISLKLTVQADYASGGEGCDDPIGEETPPGNTQGNISGSLLVYDGVQPVAGWVWQGGAWVVTSVTLDNLTLPGLDLEPEAPWSWTHESVPFQQVAAGGGLIVSSYPVPDDVGGVFTHRPIIGIEFLAHQITGAQVCYALPPPQTGGHYTAPYEPAASVMRTLSANFESLVAIRGGKAYRPYQARTVERPAVSTGFIDVYLLCRRSPADDP